MDVLSKKKVAVSFEMLTDASLTIWRLLNVYFLSVTLRFRQVFIQN